MWRKRLTRKYRILFLVLSIILALDLGSKTIIDHTVPPYESIPVISGFFSITFVKNTGAAFGLFGGAINAGRTFFFLVITIGAVILISFILRKVKENRVLPPLSLAMIMAGAIGNLVDRIRWGYVIDFLDLHWRGYHWPAFNVADSAITLGVLLLVVEQFSPQRGEGGADTAPKANGTG
jgi:signal peptidase II